MAVRIDRRWIGLHGPRSLISWIASDVMTMIVIKPTHAHPMTRWRRAPLGAASQRAERRKGMNLDGNGFGEEWRERHRRSPVSSELIRAGLIQLCQHLAGLANTDSAFGKARKQQKDL
jgi:hypothetical protein